MGKAYCVMLSLPDGNGYWKQKYLINEVDVEGLLQELRRDLSVKSSTI